MSLIRNCWTFLPLPSDRPSRRTILVLVPGFLVHFCVCMRVCSVPQRLNFFGIYPRKTLLRHKNESTRGQSNPIVCCVLTTIVFQSRCVSAMSTHVRLFHDTAFPCGRCLAHGSSINNIPLWETVWKKGGGGGKQMGPGFQGGAKNNTNFLEFKR